MNFDFSKLQKFGKALMVPVALLPAAGILLGLGAALTGPLANSIPILQSTVVSFISAMLLQLGISIFQNLPMIFAIGVAIGLSGGSGIAALASFVGYIITNTTISIILGITPEMAAESGRYGLALGIPTLETGVLGGILVGLLAVAVYNRFHEFQPPEVLGFFAGDRSVGIVMVFASMLLAGALMVIWPPIQVVIDSIANIIASDTTNPLYIGLYGGLERLLIPTGLHHIWYAPFLWTPLGGSAEIAGELVSGDQYIFLKEIAAGVDVTAGRFMAGKFPIIMFGLPGAALAMYKQADKKNKQVVKGLLIAAAGTAFLTGITEPIEFTFLFVAPFLYVFHSILTAISYIITFVLDVHLGWAGGSGVIDYILVNVLPGTPNWWMNIVIGGMFFIIYYFSFTYAIKRWDIATPGRGGQQTKLFRRSDYNKKNNKGKNGKREISIGIISGLGGKKNIKSVDACFTRLRVDVEDIKKIDEDLLKDLGASGVVKVKNSVQAIFGGYSDLYKNKINFLLKEEGIEEEIKLFNEKKYIDLQQDSDENIAKESSEGINTVILSSPAKGKLIDITEVPDEAFSQKLMGDGVAIIPSENTISAPCDGIVKTIFPTNHAFGMETKEGIELIVHIGIDTVDLNGQGFKRLVEEDTKVKKGTPIIEVDLDYIKSEGKDIVTPIAITNSDKVEKIIKDTNNLNKILEVSI
ncbi:PTS transporter subunit IIABC [Halonatronum saccharophilum]|uniref:PTS transporter subunit IIABC n=1 Tax=Halonatronum saccharophilum TaxID=150060 RepID=UPI0004815BF4|nr:PTS transporter subunit IIABC [Halonatronum saccharophilum]